MRIHLVCAARPNTERPLTTTAGTNRLCNPGSLKKKTRDILTRSRAVQGNIRYWDGKTAGRIARHLKSLNKAAKSPDNALRFRPRRPAAQKSAFVI